MANRFRTEIARQAGHRWPVTLQHGGVRLRPMKVRDRAAWESVRRVNRQWLMPWEATVPPGGEPGPPSFAALVRMLNQQAREGRMLPWVLVWDDSLGENPRAKGVLAGQVTVSGITRGSANFAQIGYWVDERLAGRGIVPTAVAMATDYCFFGMGLHRMEVAIRPENGKSLRVVEKLGFRHEGLRPGYLHINGGWRDHEVFALNADEVGEGLIHRWENRPTVP
ncbi:GNAT family N-acetyltransferase [Naumannella sp. ID2617S]|uniref:GNAT family N-acetyltransferase n=1 Tax=Enemella dayhoffiae TaxID=2016507 RepID=A0A255HAA3_9ACTN|nr:GNAT family protein [Enemella dayhoffiae]NNG21276.1 GNAT family N-acetyltransferase [Naumannella sp. ID2617S]OYO24537.1 GNAT family N-acetyltransferase [Enemella dayhoffiae]